MTEREIRDRLGEIWSVLLGTAPSEGSEFLESGGSSIAAVHLAMLAAERLAVPLRPGDVIATGTFGQLVALVVAQLPKVAIAES
jgi:hypothetical protein